MKVLAISVLVFSVIAASVTFNMVFRVDDLMGKLVLVEKRFPGLENEKLFVKMIPYKSFEEDLTFIKTHDLNYHKEFRLKSKQVKY